MTSSYSGNCNIKAGIAGVATFFPEKRLTNYDLEKFLDTSDEWITQRTGIKERRILTNKPLSYMATQAVKKLIEETSINPEDVDLLLLATVTADYRHPSTAGIVAANCGLKNAFAFDLNAACSSFLYGFITACSYISSGFAKNIILCGADKMSCILNYEDRTTCVLFGDGAAALLLKPSKKYGMIDYIAGGDGSLYHLLYQPIGGSAQPLTPKNILFNNHFVYQEGRQVFKYAVQGMVQTIKTLMERNNLTPDTIHWIVPHQANKRIIQACIDALNINPSKVVINIDKYGNTTSATIPSCLYEIKDKLNKGDNIIMVTFGGGLSFGGCYLQWGIE